MRLNPYYYLNTALPGLPVGEENESMKKLTTTSEILDYWGHSPCNCGCIEAATRIAENERLRQAFEREMEQMACVDNPACKCRMSAVRAVLEEF